jgi:hypothetical protein
MDHSDEMTALITKERGKPVYLLKVWHVLLLISELANVCILGD